ncbi:MAG TPA: hypothetical protein VMU94_10715 [Streptosporangiaceae bacterium]|nr:hypothetical protein [Streptosporangiaceae bacterium]HVB46191.1 hypothetical protein [Streptosporangiaceae bacterium]
MAAELNALTRPPGTATEGSVAVAVRAGKYRAIEYLPSTGSIITETLRETARLPVTGWARACDLDRVGDSDTFVSLIGPGPGCAMTMTTDLADPVIIATLRASHGRRLPLLDDGMRDRALSAERHTTVTFRDGRGVAGGADQARAAAPVRASAGSRRPRRVWR